MIKKFSELLEENNSSKIFDINKESNIRIEEAKKEWLSFLKKKLIGKTISFRGSKASDRRGDYNDFTIKAKDIKLRIGSGTFSNQMDITDSNGESYYILSDNKIKILD